MKQCFNINDVLKENAKECFLSSSSIKVENLFKPILCEEACIFIKKNEQNIINKYSKDKKGLTLDLINNQKFIKYFEYPFYENSKLFGKFITSDIFKISEYLLGEPVYLKSLEVHSRCSLGSSIPPHQDNAYYGLKNGKGLTFYIAINNEFANMGGLRYFKNPVTLELEHEPSDSSGFSLRVKNLDEKRYQIFSPDYLPGDCTIHHSRSIHFADAVPFNTERSLVVRISVYSLLDVEKDGHAKWYKQMIHRNRKVVNENLKEV